MEGKIVLTMVPSMMTREMAIEIKTSPTQRFLTFVNQNSQTWLYGENRRVLQLPKAIMLTLAPITPMGTTAVKVAENGGFEQSPVASLPE